MNCQKLLKLITFLAIFSPLLPSYSIARDDLVPGARFTEGRAAALGDAFLPLGEDGAAALFYNPAVLGKIQKPQLEGLNLQFYGNTDYLGLLSLTSFNFYKAASLESFLTTLQANPGVNSGVGAAILPNFSTKGFAAGVLLQSSLHGQVNTDGTVRYRSQYQLIPTVATGVRLAGGIVRLGYSLQWVNQASGSNDEVSATSSPLGFNQNLAQGSAFSHNLGFALTLPFSYLPQFNLVARNLLGTHYTAGTLLALTPTSSGLPADEPMTLDASISIQPKIGQGGYFNLVFEDRDATNVSGVSFLGRMAIGTEFSFRDIFFLRAGWGSGYPDLGIGFRRQKGEFSFSWYSEEMGTGYQQSRDLRYMLHYQVRTF